jgi:hypothetical protein
VFGASAIALSTRSNASRSRSAGDVDGPRHRRECTRGTATSINDKRPIVGVLGACSDDPAALGNFRPFYVAMIDLNDRVDPPSDLHMNEAMFINERGEIVAGVDRSDGGTRVVLLVPLPGR